MDDPGRLTAAELALLAALQAGRLVPPQALERALDRRRTQPDLSHALLETGALDAEELAAVLDAAGLAAPVGRYRLIERIASGGMGTVYRAHDPVLGRDVALKLLDAEQDAARFQREARLAARLVHRHIVTVHEVSAAPPHYIAMALIEGPTLAQALPGLPLAQRIELLAQAAEAAGHAHAHGVVHRDLKPGNVLLAAPDRAVVTDFGLAHDATAQTRLTREGAVLGTLGYLSPEQVRGEPAGPPADVWALGVMLYEMLCDRRPFEAGSGNLLDQILDAQPPPPAGPEPLRAVCLRALRKQPARRYADGAAFAVELRRWQGGRPVAARLPRARRWPWIGGAALLLVLLAWPGARPAALPRGPRPVALPAVDRRTPLALAALRRQIQEARAACYVEQADVRARLAQLEQALERWQRKGDAPPEAWALVGVGWQVAGRPRRAEPVLLAAHRRTPQDGWVNHALARLYLQRAMAALMTRGETQALQQSGRWSRAAQRYLQPAPQWSGGRPLDRQVAAAYQTLALRRFEQMRALCREGLGRFAGEPGREELLVLLGWAAPVEQRIAQWTRALAVRPHYPWLLFARGVTRLHRGDAAGAGRDLDAALRLHPHLATAWMARGMLHQSAGKDAAARADYDRALELDPTQALAWNNRGILSYRAGDHARAVADYDRAIAHDPALARAWYNRGIARRAQGRLDEAIADYGAAIRLEPSYVVAYENRGVAYRDLGRQREAAGDFGRALQLDPRRVASWLNRGACRIALKELPGAVDDFTRALQLDPDYTKALYNRAQALAALGRHAAAKADLDRLIRLTPRDPRNYNERGLLLGQRMARHAQAIADYDRAIALHPAYADAHYNRGIAHRALGKLPQAIEDFTRALRHDPRHARACNNRGTARAALGQYEAAVADYTRALELDPSLYATYFNRARALHQLGRFEAALADYRAVTRLQPAWWRGWSMHGALLGRLGRRREAALSLRRALELAPDSMRPALRKLIAALQR